MELFQVTGSLVFAADMLAPPLVISKLLNNLHPALRRVALAGGQAIHHKDTGQQSRS